MIEVDEKQKIVYSVAKKSLSASRKLRNVSTEEKKSALNRIADYLDKKTDEIVFRNEIDVEAAKEDNLSNALIDRLVLDETRIRQMTDGIREVASLEDPVGEVIEEHKRPNGLKIQKMRVPLGVICMIYESRPNVTGDSAALCLMSSNSVILRGGTESLNSNMAIGSFIRDALKDTAIPKDAVQVIDNSDRKIIEYLVSMKGIIDIIIPRGSEEMINAISRISAVPIIGHGKGLCHLYIDKDADIKKAIDITLNAKVQRPGVCNAIETLLVHREIADKYIPEVSLKLQEEGVVLRGDEYSRTLFEMEEAVEEDWNTEYLDLILAVKVVENLDEALEHIEKYGSKHSDSIVSEDQKACDSFHLNVDSACVYSNASTRFTDGNQMGLGAEIGISNQKLHARGPMGLKELTSYKYVITGEGQVRP